jgi:hypothetical protein
LNASLKTGFGFYGPDGPPGSESPTTIDDLS